MMMTLLKMLSENSILGVFSCELLLYSNSIAQPAPNELAGCSRIRVKIKLWLKRIKPAQIRKLDKIVRLILSSALCVGLKMSLEEDKLSSLVDVSRIQRIFKIFLGRDCELASANYFIDSKFTVNKLIDAVFASDEYRHKFVECRSLQDCPRNTATACDLSVKNHVLKYAPKGNVSHIIHSYYDFTPDLNLEIYNSSSMVSVDDVPLCRRLIEAYKASVNKVNDFDGMNENRGVWNVVAGNSHNEIIEILNKEDAEELCVYLTNAIRAPVGFGLQSLGSFQSSDAARYIENGGRLALEYKLLLKDRFIRLAEALGVLPVENPEQGRYGKNIHLELPFIIEAIESELGVPFDRPKILGLFGFHCNGNLYDSKTPEDAYIASRVKSFDVSSVEEIGGGYGGVAFQLARYGIRSTVFDIPVAGVLQGFYLGKALGTHSVNLAGEQNWSALVQILPWPIFFERPMSSSLVFNRDSMAEFRADIAQSYCSEMKRRKSLFLSINQEVEGPSGDPGVNQINVAQTAKSVGFTRVSRNCYWMRRGYVEELFR